MAKRARRGDERLAVGYIRVSTNKQELGPEAQREALNRWCEARGVRLVAVFEEVLSGKTPLAKRPGFAAALEALTTARAGFLLVAKRDRLARDLYVTLQAEAVLAERGALVASAAGEGSEDENPLQRRIHDIFGEQERLEIGRRTKAALAVKRARGERTGGVPLGSRTVVGADGVARLEGDPAEQAAIARMRELRADGISFDRIARQLAADGHATRSGGRWHATQVQRALAA